MSSKAPTSGQVPGRRSPAILRSMLWLFVCPLLSQTLAGCGSDTGPQTVPPSPVPPPPPVPQPPPSTAAWHGYFAGSLILGGNTRYAEALLTVDGAVRIYVGGSSGGTFDRGEALQFIGQIEVDGDEAFGSGIIIGEHCTVVPGPYCAAPASGEIDIFVATQSLLSGDIRVTTTDGEQPTWTFEMSWPTSTYIDEPATTAFAQGQYREMLAEFASRDDVTINVDETGEIFFQSPETGCVGNGILTPYLNGEFNVYDGNLMIDNCTGAYAYLNGDFEGLATRTVDYETGWGDWLVIWLSSPDGVLSPAAITIWGRNINSFTPWDY